MTTENPFEYAGANDLSVDTILEYYIEDFNFSRFVGSSRNVFLVGERGCGKSMTLLYSSFPVQQLRREKEGEAEDLSFLGIYIPCNTPLNQKREQQLLDDFRAAVISEHFLVISLAYGLATTLSKAINLLTMEEEESFRNEFQFLLGAKLPDSSGLFESLMLLLDFKNLEAQRAINSRDNLDVFFSETYSFPTLIMPMLRTLRTAAKLSSSHFGFMIDDAQDLNDEQRRSLFSWVAFRDHSLFSLKVAITNLERVSLKTASGGSILEGHDYTKINMIRPFQNDGADFGQYARRLIRKRLKIAKFDGEPDAFFPTSLQMATQLAISEQEVHRQAVEKYGDDKRKISDHVYKYKRPHFFRNRPPKANRPEYSGFETLVYLSTGVVRNLLVPCYWMYDKSVSQSPGTTISEISPSVQSEVIIERSQDLWKFAEHELDKVLEGCSGKDAKRAFNLLDQLAILFRNRLRSDISEPAAISFSISKRNDPAMEELASVLTVLISAQLLYTRMGSAKDDGRQEIYFVPNRMLWPSRGLDPHGQHARVQLKSWDLLAAADRGAALPFSSDDDDTPAQKELWDE